MNQVGWSLHDEVGQSSYGQTQPQFPTSSNIAQYVVLVRTTLVVPIIKFHLTRQRPLHLEDILKVEKVQELVNFHKVVQDPRWRVSMEKEMSLIDKNDTWTLIDLPKGKAFILAKWVLEVKKGPRGEVDTSNARLVAHGFEQKVGINYKEIFCLIVKWPTLKTLIVLVTSNGWKQYHLDVKTTFKNNDLNEKVFMYQPKGFILPWNEYKVCKQSTNLMVSNKSLGLGMKT